MNRPLSHAGTPEPIIRLFILRLGEQELRRRLWHFLPGIIAMVLAAVPHRETVRLPVMLSVVAFGILLPAFLAIRHQRTYCRCAGENLAPSILGYVIPVSLLCLLCRSHIEIPLAVTGMIAFGDGTATLFGMLVQGRKVPWNRQKSWIGLAAFACFGTLLPGTIYWIAARDSVGYPAALACMAPVAAACAFLESLPLKLNDNITIGCSAAALLLLVQTCLVGWS